MKIYVVEIGFAVNAESEEEAFAKAQDVIAIYDVSKRGEVNYVEEVADGDN